MQRVFHLFIIISACLITLASCNPPQQMSIGSLGQFNKGDSVGVFSNFNLVEPSYEWKFTDIPGAGEIDVVMYEAIMYKTSSDIMFFSIPSGYYYYYAFAFKDNKLIYWGYPDDFLRSDNETYRKIGEKIADSILNES